ncbi:MAG: ferredoxin-thioredoxin reductase catalytic domain-containing protein [Promethearchaeota archaeon]
MTNLENVRRRAESDAKTRGYYLNPDPDFLKNLLQGLKQNEERYGYPSCPCRLAAGNFELDRDIICPCDYRDPDVEEFGVCYCSLFVNKNVYEGKTPAKRIPERRPKEKEVKAFEPPPEISGEKPSKTTTGLENEISKTNQRMWYCKQCGYVCYREEPPYTCPICKAKKEFFAKLMTYVIMKE